MSYTYKKRNKSKTITTERINKPGKYATVQKNNVVETREMRRDEEEKKKNKVKKKALKKEKNSITIESLLETLCKKSRGNLCEAGKSETTTRMTRRESKHWQGKNAKQGKQKRKQDKKSDIPRSKDHFDAIEKI